MDLKFKIKKLFNDASLVGAGDCLLIGVSGGVDSMSLLDILNAIKDDIGFLISAVHINHGLRGEESDCDEAFVKEFCKKNGIEFHARKWSGSASGENMHDSARNFRYETFFKIAAEIKANIVVTAHNMDDQAETVLLNLIRGSGLDGLTGMKLAEKRGEQTVLRPLISISRREIAEYASSVSLEFRNDSSNDKSKYKRNFVRHNLMPLVEEINSNATDVIAGMAEILSEDENFLQGIAEAESSKAVSRKGDRLEINSESLKKNPAAIRRRILKNAYVALTGTVAGLSKDHILQMEHLALTHKEDGCYSLPNGLMFEKKGVTLAIFKK